MPPPTRRQMTILQANAAHSSVSYCEISAERFAEIVKGAAPTTGEKVSVCQGLTEMHAVSINRDRAAELAEELAEELGLSRAAVEARCRELCGAGMGAHAFPAELPVPPVLLDRT